MHKILTALFNKLEKLSFFKGLILVGGYTISILLVLYTFFTIFFLEERGIFIEETQRYILNPDYSSTQHGYGIAICIAIPNLINLAILFWVIHKKNYTLQLLYISAVVALTFLTAGIIGIIEYLIDLNY